MGNGSSIVVQRGRRQKRLEANDTESSEQKGKKPVKPNALFQCDGQTDYDFNSNSFFAEIVAKIEQEASRRSTP